MKIRVTHYIWKYNLINSGRSSCASACACSGARCYGLCRWWCSVGCRVSRPGRDSGIIHCGIHSSNLSRLTCTPCTVSFDLGGDNHKDPINYLLQSRGNIARGDYNSINNSCHGEITNGDWLSHVGLGAVSDIRDLEILNSDAIDTPEIVPPLKEWGINPSFSQILSDLINIHGVVLRKPQRHILILN